jgi:hypothetical protein
MLNRLSEQVEAIILKHDNRGITKIKPYMESGYCLRASKLILDSKETVLIGTGFPVAGTFESDGPIGAIALYQVLTYLEYKPIFVCAPPLSKVLSKDFRTYEIPIADWNYSHQVVQEALDVLKPSLIISIERPGVTADKKYYNMYGDNITEFAAKFDLFFKYCQCPTVAFGDGGNEIGMGNVLHAISELGITPSTTCCDELIIATVSNWGVYGVIAIMSRILKDNLLRLFEPKKIMEHLFEQGCVDGVTLLASHSGEDGFHINISVDILKELSHLVRV